MDNLSFPTPSQSVSHKRFHQCVNHKKKLSLRHPLPTFGSFSFFQASLWLGVDKVLQKLSKSYKSELRNLFQCCILIPRKYPCKIPFQHTVWDWAAIAPPPPSISHGPDENLFRFSFNVIKVGTFLFFNGQILFASHTLLVPSPTQSLSKDCEVLVKV